MNIWKHFEPIRLLGNALRRLRLAMSEEANTGAKSENGENLAREGKAEVFLPGTVFYNPVQEFNRDLTISVIREHAKEHFTNLKENKGGRKKKKKPETDPPEVIPDADELEMGKKYQHGLRVLEGLAASGLRSVRFALEIPGLKEVVANDFDPKAVEFIHKNVEHNKVHDLVTPSHDDASLVMYKNRKLDERFDVIDLDPYGSPAQFLDGAVQAVDDGGLLCVTSTDMAVLCGNAAEKCHAAYGAVPLKSKFCHEMALRILLQSIDSHANHYARYIEPLLSISVDFYIRVFVRLRSGAREVKDSCTKRSHVYWCSGCGAFQVHPIVQKVQTTGDNYRYLPAVGPPVGKTCGECGWKYHMGGPVWSHRLHDPEFVQKVIAGVETNKGSDLGVNTADRIGGMLRVVEEELHDQPLYYITDELCKVIHCVPPPLLTIRSAILNAGYQVSMSHAAKNSIKTDAPNNVIWDIMRCWVKENPVDINRLKEGTPAHVILQREPALTASFEIRDDANPDSRKKGVLRYQHKPERDWGPKQRAGEKNMSLDERRAHGVKKSEERRAKRKKQQEENAMEEEKAPKINKSNEEDSS